MPEIKKDVEKAKEEIEKKGEDLQNEKDRIDESVSEQLKDDGDEDEQDARDRVDESEGEEKHEETEEHDEASDKEDVTSAEGLKALIREAIADVIGAEIKKAFSEMVKPDPSERESTPVEKKTGMSLEAAMRKYSN